MKKELQDYVWKYCLPKEFREEVKKLYAKFYNEKPHSDCSYGYLGLLIKLFGHHNLTSDAEVEVELLHVTRQKMMGLYANAKKIHDLYTSATCINTKESQQIDICKGAMSILDTLFGSKCLPDNVDSSKAKVDSLSQNSPENCDNGNLISNDNNKPFKEGDVVRIKPTADKLHQGYQNGYAWLPERDEYLGRVASVKEIWCDGSIILSIRDNMMWEPIDLEPYTEPEDTILQPFCQRLESTANTEPKDEVVKMKPIESKVSVYLATKKEDEEFRMLLHENGFVWNMGNSLIDKSNWASDPKDFQIHFVYPDMTVTYCGERTSDTLTFNEFKKRYFGEEYSPNVNNSDMDIAELVAKGYVVDPAKHFDTILKGSFSKERRLNIAAMAMQGLLANSHQELVDMKIEQVAQLSLEMTDALIAEAEKGGSK